MPRLTVTQIEDIDRDELAERRERDRQREPGAKLERAFDLVRRRAFQAGVIDSVNVAMSSASMRHECPGCGGPVYVTADSNAERVDCVDCNARLVTMRLVDGSVVVVETGGAS